MAAFIQKNEDLRIRRQLKRSGLLKIGSFITLFVVFVGGFVLVYDQTRRAGKDTRAQDPPLIAEFGPGLRGVSYSSYANNQQDITFKATRISIRNRRFNGHILNFCKDVVISNMHVRVKSQQLEGVMDWVHKSHLDSITSILFFDYRLLVSKEISNINIRFVVQPLQIDLISPNTEFPIISMSADTMFKEGTTDDLIFKGNFRLFLRNRELIRSQLAKWVSEKNGFLFPAGFIFHRSFYPNSPAAEGNEYISMAEIKSLLDKKGHIQNFAAGHTIAKKINRRKRNKNGISASLDFERIGRNLDKLDKKSQKMIVLELLATNPGIFNQLGLSPALLLFPNFRLGAFEPGPFFGGLGKIL